MKRLSLVFVLGLALPASAGDATYGQKAFEASCSKCHKAQRVTGSKSPEDLALWLSANTGDKLRTWVKNPWAVRPATLCDPRQLQPQELSDLITYLRGFPKP